jgi:exopolysaccharide production protein ExoZ
MVVWGHIAGLWTTENRVHFSGWELYIRLIATPFHLYQGGGHLGVATFFLISGYIISHVAKDEGRIEFAVKRFFRLFPPLVAAIFVMYVAATASAYLELPKMLTNDAVSVRDYVVSSFLLNYAIDKKPLALALAWSLYAEVIFYCIVAFVIPILRSRPIGSTLIMLGIYSAIILPFNIFEYLNYMAYFTAYLPLFIIGRIFYLEHTGEITGKQGAIMTVLTFLLFCLFYSARWPGLLFDTASPPITTYVLAIVVFYALMHAHISNVPRPLAYLAEISYMLYLIHVPVGFFLMNLLHKWSWPVSYTIAAGLISGFLAAVILTHLIDKPSQRFARFVIVRLVPRRSISKPSGPPVIERSEAA